MSILFTPWGEGLVHRHYRSALHRLSQLPQVHRVCIQTNLSAPLQSFNRAHKKSLALWATYHPDQVSLTRFLENCRLLDQMSVRYSVGIVGLKEHLDDMEALRQALHPKVYLWVNAYKRVPDYYASQDLVRIRAVDPHFDLNLQRYPSLNRECRAGETHFTVDGKGDVRRCHFVGRVLTNIYHGDLVSVLGPRLCPVETCGCYIGYIHRPQLKLESLYGEDLLARIPQSGSAWSGANTVRRAQQGPPPRPEKLPR